MHCNDGRAGSFVALDSHEADRYRACRLICARPPLTYPGAFSLCANLLNAFFLKAETQTEDLVSSNGGSTCAQCGVGRMMSKGGGGGGARGIKPEVGGVRLRRYFFWMSVERAAQK